MKTLTAADLDTELAPLDRAWQLLLEWCLESGPPTRLEGSLDATGDELLWVRHHHQEVEERRMPGRVFRPLMARLSTLVQAPDPYGSVATFAWENARSTGYFRLFFCNEPSLDFWLRLYHYGGSQNFDEIKVEEAQLP